MLKTPFVWLGSGRARKWGVGSKGRLLDTAVKAGLPVPAGGILLEEFYQIVLAEGVIGVENGRITVPDPVWLSDVLYRDVRFPRLRKPAAIRHAFSLTEDAAQLNGRFPAHLAVDMDDPQQLAMALSALWSAVSPQSQTIRRDVLIMEMVVVQAAGRAITRQAETVDRVLLEGETAETFTLPKLRAFQRTARDVPPFARRLQKLLRGARAAFGKGDWAIEWADDGRICWLLQTTSNQPLAPSH